MQKRSCLVVLAAVWLASVPAFAKGKHAKDSKEPAPAPPREARELDARRACMEGDYAKGVAILVDLFLETKDATYVFNQGRCFEQNERYPEAISRFREYLRMGDATHSALAKKHIAECEELEARKQPAPAAQPAFAQPAPVRAPVAAAAPVQPLPVAVGRARRTEAQPTSSGRGLRATGVVFASVGVAGLITGVVLNLKANSMASDIEPPNTYQRSTESSRKNYETLGWVGYGVGAAGLAAGTVLYLFGRSQGGPAEVALVPTIGAGMAGATLRGAF